MKVVRILFLAAIAFALNACSSGVDLPKGTSKGYNSARLVARRSGVEATADQNRIHGMIQKSIAAEFSANGMAYNQGSADLVVAYLVVQQDNAMTTYFDDFYGQGRDPEEISEAAHKKNVIDGKRPDRFERAGVVIDVIDARTNELVYRNFAAGDIVRSNSDSVRAAKITQAVNNALGPFFKK